MFAEHLYSDSEGEEEERDGRRLLIDYQSGWRAEEEVAALEARAQYVAQQEAQKPSDLQGLAMLAMLRGFRSAKMALADNGGADCADSKSQWIKASVRQAAVVLCEYGHREDITPELKDAAYMLAASYGRAAQGTKDFEAMSPEVQEVFLLAHAAVHGNPLGKSGTRFYDPHEFSAVLLESADMQRERLFSAEEGAKGEWARLWARLKTCAAHSPLIAAVESAAEDRSGEDGEWWLEACQLQLEMSGELQRGWTCLPQTWEAIQESRHHLALHVSTLIDQRRKVDSLRDFAKNMGRPGRAIINI